VFQLIHSIRAAYYISLMKRQFVLTHTILQAEILAY